MKIGQILENGCGLNFQIVDIDDANEYAIIVCLSVDKFWKDRIVDRKNGGLALEVGSKYQLHSIHYPWWAFQNTLLPWLVFNEETNEIQSA